MTDAPDRDSRESASPTDARDPSAERTRRIVALAAIPLGVIALGMFAAVLVPYGWPLKWRTVVTPFDDGFSPFHVIHAGAGILAVAIAVANRRHAPPGAFAVAVALLVIVGASVGTMIAVKGFLDGNYWTHVLVFVAPVAVAPVIAFNALRARGWDRMLGLLGSFAIAALPYSCPLIPGMFDLFSGGLVYFTALVTLLGLFARGLRRE